MMKTAEPPKTSVSWPWQGDALQPGSLAVFYRSLATMYAVGVRTDRALSLMVNQSEDPRLQEICYSLTRGLHMGQSLSASMSAWPSDFGQMDIKLVAMGELTGTLPRILERLARYEEERRAVVMRLKSALTYPAIVFVVALLALVLLPPYLFGGLFKMIEGLDVQVPLLTRMVLVFSHVVSSRLFWVFVLGIVIAATRFLPPYLRQPPVRRELVGRLMELPVIGYAIRMVAVTRFARAMEVMLTVGISMEQSFTMAFDASTNPVLQATLPRALEDLRQGNRVTQCLSATKFFPRAFLQIVSIGEESGRLSYLLSKITHMYEQELEYSLETLIAALEPIMLMVMGVIVGVFVIATMMPMMQLIQHL